MNTDNQHPRRDFVAIDVEYADAAQNICQFGLAVVRDLQIVEQRSWNIQPPGNVYEQCFAWNHHLTAADTANAPSFEQIWPEIYEYLRGESIWAHNAASTEYPVINKNICRCNADFDTLRWINDSRDLYRRTDCEAGKGNGLHQCCMALGIPFDESQHHSAEYDAVKCAEIVIAAIEGRRPDWTGIPVSKNEFRKLQQEKRILRLGEFQKYYASTSSGEEDIIAVLSSTYEGAPEQVIDVFDKGDIAKEEAPISVDFSRLNVSSDNALHGKRVCLTGLFRYERKDIERAISSMGAVKVPKPARNTDAVIIGFRNVGFTKLIAIEEQKERGHHIARIVGDDDLETLLYSDGNKFFNNI